MRVKVLPEFDCLYKPAPWKCHYGGRGAAKSYAYADALLVTGIMRKCKILCAREFQNSIRNSVHSLLSQRIDYYGLHANYTVKQNYITGINGTQFFFEGVAHNIDSIRSIPGITHCWLEEAESVSEESWDVIIPTIREEDSEIWVTFNPARDDDPTYKRLIINPPPGAIVKKVYYYDNPFLSDKARAEAEYCKKTNYSKYMHIWEGNPITNYDTLVYRWDDRINESRDELVYRPGGETFCTWDFGTADNTAIIAGQIWQTPPTQDNRKGVVINILWEYSNAGKDCDHYREIVKDIPFPIDRWYCDPSGTNRAVGLASWVDKLGLPFEYEHSYSVAESIDNANEYLPGVRINRSQCPQVFNMFRRWQYRTDSGGRLVLPPKPEHDEFSHYGTAFYFMTNVRFAYRSGGGVYVH